MSNAMPPPGGPAAPLPPPTVTPPASAARPDLDDILGRLHDEHGLDPAAPVAPANSPLTDARQVTRPTRPAGPPIESTGGVDFDPEFAAFVPRLVGWLIDTAVMLVLMAPGVAVAMAADSAGGVIGGVLLAVVGFAVASVLYARAVSRRGGWIGNRVTRTEVVDVLNGSHLDAGRGGTRFVIRQLVSTIFFFGFLMALGDSQRRGFHDQVASSIVVRPPRQVWTIDDEVPSPTP